jgi:Tol biopolymer transport system component
MPASGGAAVKLTPDYLVAGKPEYSPDGSKIAFIDNFCACPALSHVWVMNADGSGFSQVTAGDAYNDGPPAWSPDGKQIAMERTNVATGDIDIWVMRADGSKLHNVTNAPGHQIEPDWVP